MYLAVFSVSSDLNNCFSKDNREITDLKTLACIVHRKNLVLQSVFYCFLN